jgi:transglutaminase-like putative cysteine protease
VPSFRERLSKPREGWLSLILLVVMLLSLAWAVQAAGWLEQSEYLVPVALLAALAGALLAITPLSVALTVPISALLGALVLVWSIGGEYYPQLTQLGRLFALRDDLLSWLVALLRTGYPSQLTPYALGLGVLLWTTAFMAAYTLYRHHRLVDAVVLVGAALITNMSATFTNLFGHLVLFVAAALLLWLRVTLVGRQEGWLRRRVNENAEVPAAIMRSGILFAATSIVLAWILTSVAVAAPLTSAWRNLDTVWSDVQDGLDGVFGTLTNSESRISGTSFGSRFTVTGKWISKDDTVMTVASTKPYYLRTATYDVYTGRGWTRSDGQKRQVAPGNLIFPDDTTERPTAEEPVVETVTVKMEKALGRSLFAPGFPIKAFAPLVVYETAKQPLIGGLEAANAIAPGEAYQVSVSISHATEGQLSGAGTDYPKAIRDLYLNTTGLTARTRDLALQLAATAGATDPYFRAKALAQFLSQDPRFTYATDAPVPTTPGQDLVDFFLFDEKGKIGYCEYYASAMVLMARSLGIPARIAVGFAPGQLNADKTFTIRERNSHAWAELYFPGYGWQIFEATKTINAAFTRTSGGPRATPPPMSRARLIDLLEKEANQTGTVSSLSSFKPLEGGFDVTRDQRPGDESRGGNALLIVALLLGALGFLYFRLRRSQRRWRFLAPAERAWLRLALAADRAGASPRASETIYEYSGWLEEQIPKRRPEIRTLADGKVWQAYSGRSMNLSAIERLEIAWRRIRLPLMWLVVRRRLGSIRPRRRR